MGKCGKTYRITGTILPPQMGIYKYFVRNYIINRDINIVKMPLLQAITSVFYRL